MRKNYLSRHTTNLTPSPNGGQSQTAAAAAGVPPTAAPSTLSPMTQQNKIRSVGLSRPNGSRRPCAPLPLPMPTVSPSNCFSPQTSQPPQQQHQQLTPSTRKSTNPTPIKSECSQSNREDERMKDENQENIPPPASHHSNSNLPRTKPHATDNLVTPIKPELPSIPPAVVTPLTHFPTDELPSLPEVIILSTPSHSQDPIRSAPTSASSNLVTPAKQMNESLGLDATPSPVAIKSEMAIVQGAAASSINAASNMEITAAPNGSSSCSTGSNSGSQLDLSSTATGSKPHSRRHHRPRGRKHAPLPLVQPDSPDIQFLPTFTPSPQPLVKFETSMKQENSNRNHTASRPMAEIKHDLSSSFAPIAPVTPTVSHPHIPVQPPSSHDFEDNPSCHPILLLSEHEIDCVARTAKDEPLSAPPAETQQSVGRPTPPAQSSHHTNQPQQQATSESPYQMHDDSFIDSLDHSAMEFPGFIAPFMEVAHQQIQQRNTELKSSTVNRAHPSATAQAAAAAAAAFPVTPSSSAASGVTTPPRTPICRSLQPSSPLTPVAVTTKSPPRVLYPKPPQALRERIIRHWEVSLGKDIVGRTIGHLLEHALACAQQEDNVPYEAYAAFLERKFQEQPDLKVSMAMDNVSVLKLMDMYPPSTMPHPPLTWDQVAKSIVVEAPPIPSWRNRKASMSTSSSSTKSKLAAAASSKGSQSIIAFTSPHAPSVAQKLIQDVEAKIAATPRKPSMEESYQAHRDALSAQPPTPITASATRQPMAMQTPQHQPQLRTPTTPAAAVNSTSSSNLLTNPPPRFQQPPTPTRRLDDELRAVSEEQDMDLTPPNQLDFTPIQRQPQPQQQLQQQQPPLVLTELPELERPPPLNLYSEPHLPTSAENEPQPMELDHISPVKLEFQPPPQPFISSIHQVSPTIQLNLPTRSAADFLSHTPAQPPIHPTVVTPHQLLTTPQIPSNLDRLRTPIQVPPTPIVTISPLTTSSNSSSATSSSDHTPSPGQRRRDFTTPVAMPPLEDDRESNQTTTAAVGQKRSHAATANRTKSKKAKSFTTATSNEPSTDPSNTTAPPVNSTSTKPGYHQVKRKLNQRGKAVSKRKVVQRGQWKTTADGERQYISREDGQVCEGRMAHEKEQAERSALMRRAALKRSRAEVDLTDSQDESRPIVESEPTIPPQHSLTDWNIPEAIAATYRALGVPSLYDWQVECLQKPGVIDGKSNLVYSASTSAGKTLVAEILMLNRMLHSPTSAIPTDELELNSLTLGNRKVLFVLPYVSIVDEKCRDLTAKLSRSGFCIKSYHGQQSGQNQNLNSITPEIDVAVAVIEKAGMLWDSLRDDNRLDELCAVIIDELHMISCNSDSQECSQKERSINQDEKASGNISNRGYLLELLLTKVVQYNHHRLEKATSDSSSAGRPLPIQIIGMSATLPNMDLFQSWLSPCQLYHTSFRPVPLKEYILFQKVLYQKVENSHTHQQQLSLAQTGGLARPTSSTTSSAPGPRTERFRFDKVRDVKPSDLSEQVRLRKFQLSQPQPERPQPPTRAEETEKNRKLAHLLLLADLIDESGGGTLVFCPTKKEVEQTAIDLAHIIRKRDKVSRSGVRVDRTNAATAGSTTGGGVQRTLDSMVATATSSTAIASASTVKKQTQVYERTLLIHRLSTLNEGLDPTLKQTIPVGVAYHHAGLTGDERLMVETAFRSGVIQVLCCTSTLAAGVNLPARRVIFNGCRIGPRLLSVTEYQQMSGRAGRTGLDTKSAEGSSILIVQSQDEFTMMKDVLNLPLPDLKSSLDMASDVNFMPTDPINHSSTSISSAPPPPLGRLNLYLSHGILDSIASFKTAKVQRQQVDSYLSHTLLAHQRAKAEQKEQQRNASYHPPQSFNKSQATSPAVSTLPASLSSEIEMNLNHLVACGLVDGRSGLLTSVGTAITEAGLNPYEGRRIYLELLDARRRGINLSSTLHICWLLTPPIPKPKYPSPGADERLFIRIRSRWAQITLADRKVLSILPIPPSNHPIFADSRFEDTTYHDHVIGKSSSRQTIAWSDRHAAYIRCYEAMVLQDLLNETKAFKDIRDATQRQYGELHGILRQSCLLCNQIIVLCEALFWRDFSLVFESYRDRFASNGAQAELLQLLRIPEMKMRRARDLYAAGFTTIESIAVSGSPQRLFEIFQANQEFRAAAPAGTAAVAPSQQARVAKEQHARQRVLMESATQIFNGARELLMREQKTKSRLFEA